MKRIISVFILSLLIFGVLCGCSFGKELVIVTDNSYEPYCYVNSEGEAEGFDIELIKLVAKIEGLKIEIVPVNLSDGLDAVLSGDADAAIGALVPSNIEGLEFSDVYFNGYALAVKSGENKKLLSKFNDGVIKLTENGKLNALVEKYSLGEMSYE